MIREYKYKGQLCYTGKVICPNCKAEYEIDTTDKNLTVHPPICFMCTMANKNVKL